MAPARDVTRAAAPGNTRDASAAGIGAISSRRSGSTSRRIGIGGDPLHDVARVVQALRDDAGKRRADDGAGRRALRRPPCSLGTRDLGLGVGHVAVRVLHFAPRDDAALDELARAGLRDAGVFEQGLRPRDLRLVTGRLGRSRRHVEPHEDVAARDAIACSGRHLHDARRLRWR